MPAGARQKHRRPRVPLCAGGLPRRRRRQDCAGGARPRARVYIDLHGGGPIVAAAATREEFSSGRRTQASATARRSCGEAGAGAGWTRDGHGRLSGGQQRAVAQLRAT